MDEDIDEFFQAAGFAAPPGFAGRVTAMARAMPQPRAPARAIKPWQWAPLAAGAALGALQLAEFVFFAFVAAAAG